MQHLLSLLELNKKDIDGIFSLAGDLKRQRSEKIRPQLLTGHVLTQVFEKPSLRTRVSFESAMMEVGGNSIFLSAQEAGLNGRESLADVARVLSSYSDAIVLRTFSQVMIEEFARHAGCPIINGLSDTSHPCQALADLFTIREVLGNVANHRLVYIGDGNNVAASLAAATATLGMPMTVVSPPGHELPASFLRSLRRKRPSVDLTQTHDPHAAVKDAAIVYTDVWVSMGQEDEAEHRKKVFSGFQVNQELLAAAPRECRFMHCLPARRGVEVTDDVLDGPQSIVFQQAENRKHLAKGLLVWLLKR